jgi:medium-chain acyl-[acyl-carrier-protein] hydrolase
MTNEVKSIWTETYPVNTFLVNPHKRLGLFGLLNLLQDTAWIHATHLGHGHEDMIREEALWVITRQKLTMTTWPTWGQTVQIRTWVRPMSGISAVRDFEILSDGKIVGECVTSWLTLDMKTRKPISSKGIAAESYFRTDHNLTITTSKIPLQTHLKPLIQFAVRNSDLDMNGHVNNTRYAQWVLDSIPMDMHEKYELKTYEVNFLAETHNQDRVIINGQKVSEILPGQKIFNFEGQRVSDGKIIFSSRLEAMHG